MDDIFDKSLSELGFTIRPAKIFEREKIETVGDLVRYTEDELMRMKNFGKRSLDEVERVLKKLGLHLGMSETDTIQIDFASKLNDFMNNWIRDEVHKTLESAVKRALRDERKSNRITEFSLSKARTHMKKQYENKMREIEYRENNCDKYSKLIIKQLNQVLKFLKRLNNIGINLPSEYKQEQKEYEKLCGELQKLITYIKTNI